MPLGTKVGLGPGDIVLDGDSAPPMERGTEAPPPYFSAHVCCGQTVDRWNTDAYLAISTDSVNVTDRQTDRYLYVPHLYTRSHGIHRQHLAISYPNRVIE